MPAAIVRDHPASDWPSPRGYMRNVASRRSREQLAAADAAGEGDVLGEAGPHVGVGVPAGARRSVGTVDREHRPERDRRSAAARRATVNAAAAHQRDDVGQRGQPLARASASCHGCTETTAPGRRSTAAASPSSRSGPGPHVGVEEHEQSARSLRAAPIQQACGLPTQPGGQVRRGDDRRAASGGDGGGVVGRVVVDDDELVARAQLGEQRGEQVRQRAASSRAGTTTATAGRSAAGRRSGRVDHSSSQPTRPAGGVQGPRHRRAIAVTSPSRVAEPRAAVRIDAMAERPRRQEQERGVRRGHRGGARRAALPSCRSTCPASATSTATCSRTSAASRSSTPACPARRPFTRARPRAWPAPASRSRGCTPSSSPTATPTTSAAPAGCATRPAPTSSPTSASA